MSEIKPPSDASLNAGHVKAVVGPSDEVVDVVAALRRMLSDVEVPVVFSPTLIVAARLLKRLSSEPWRPIETAPKDGTQFQAWVVSEQSERGSWEPRCRFNEDGAFQIYGRIDYDMDGWDCYLHLKPTHWQPLPAPPNGVTATPSDAASDAATRRPSSSLPVTRSDVLEEAARVAESDDRCPAAGIAHAIRSLKDTSTGSGEGET